MKKVSLRTLYRGSEHTTLYSTKLHCITVHFLSLQCIRVAVVPIVLEHLLIRTTLVAVLDSYQVSAKSYCALYPKTKIKNIKSLEFSA